MYDIFPFFSIFCGFGDFFSRKKKDWVFLLKSVTRRTGHVWFWVSEEEIEGFVSFHLTVFEFGLESQLGVSGLVCLRFS